MSGTLSFTAGQVFTGGTDLTGAVGQIALTQAGTVTFDTTLTPPVISTLTVTQDVLASSTSTPISTPLGTVNATLESATIESVNTAALVTLTTNDLPPNITLPTGFTLPQTVEGTTLHVSVAVSAGIAGLVNITGDVGVYGISGNLALVSVQDLVADGATFDVGAAVLSLGTQNTGAVSETFTPSFGPAPCFAAGTRIATPDGPVAVEALAAGMRVLLADGGSAEVVWIGHRRIDCARHPKPEDVRPVRVAAHAFGLDRPSRDLWLSPDHSVFIDDVLIPIRYLMNGVTVAQVAVDQVEYFHVELPRHAVLLAEGLTCESYLDTGNRGAFANGGTTVMAHADFAWGVWAAKGCAPIVIDGPARDAVFRRLIAQAMVLGQRRAAA